LRPFYDAKTHGRQYKELSVDLNDGAIPRSAEIMITVFFHPDEYLVPSTWSETPGHQVEIGFYTDTKQFDFSGRPEILAVPVLTVPNGSLSDTGSLPTAVGFVHVPGITDTQTRNTPPQSSWQDRYADWEPDGQPPSILDCVRAVGAMERMVSTLCEQHDLSKYHPSCTPSLGGQNEDGGNPVGEQSVKEQPAAPDSSQTRATACLREVCSWLERRTTAYTQWSLEESCRRRDQEKRARGFADLAEPPVTQFMLNLLDQYRTVMSMRLSGAIDQESTDSLEGARRWVEELTVQLFDSSVGRKRRGLQRETTPQST